MNKSHSQTQSLDLALSNKPPEVQAKAREMAQKLNISPDDELFIFIAIICDLELLLEKGPLEFEQAIIVFQKELNQWSDLNLATLARMTMKSEILNQLASSSEQLTSILTELSEICSSLIKQLQASNQQLNSSLTQLQQQQMSLNNSLSQISTNVQNNTQQLKNSQKSISLLYQKLLAYTKKEHQKPNSIYKIGVIALISSTFTMVWLFIGMIFIMPRMMPINTTPPPMSQK